MHTNLNLLKAIHIYITIFLCFFFSSVLRSQSTFEFKEGKKKDKIRFELVNNLVIIPVKVNGVELSFLLDTGVKETVVFNISKVDTLTLKNAKMLTIKGINDEEVKAVKSEDNLLEVGDLKSEDHAIYVIFNQSTNLSAYLGTEIHGILGYHFFKDFLLEFSYLAKTIRVYPEGVYKSRWRRFHQIPLLFSRGKPHIEAKMNNKKVRLLIDTGMSDSLWMFEEDSLSIKNYGYYEDFLGMTISGEIYGKRSKVNHFEFVDEFFSDVKIAYPFPETLPDGVRGIINRSGSIGGELLKRFSLVMDYSNQIMYIKKNKLIKEPFHYNKSGIVLRQNGEAVYENRNNPILKKLQENNFTSFVDISYLLSPEFIIDHVREGSPAYLAGVLKDDIVLEINGIKSYNYTLNTLNELFYEEEDKKVRLKLKRGNQVLTKTFYLKSPLIKKVI